jgi:hypothetical protein
LIYQITSPNLLNWAVSQYLAVQPTLAKHESNKRKHGACTKEFKPRLHKDSL